MQIVRSSSRLAELRRPQRGIGGIDRAAESEDAGGMKQPDNADVLAKCMTLNGLWARFKVIDS